VVCRVTRWRQDLGRGEVYDSEADEFLEFDASAALVADFHLGEVVEITVRTIDGQRRVTGIGPASAGGNANGAAPAVPLLCYQITRWDPVSGRGEIYNANNDRLLGFDASVALADDFRVGEDVEATAQTIDGELRITKIAPVAARPDPAAATAVIPDALCAELERANRLIRGSFAWVEPQKRSGDGRLELWVYNQEWPPPSRPIYGVIAFDGVLYDALGEFDAVPISAYPWTHWKKHNVELAASWAANMAREPSPDSFVFAFEGERFDGPRHHVVARRLEVREIDPP